tara:strand:- start:456 stop:599 length:144 start_codon:yes stop_codon:yes gene_type:complete
VRLSGFDIAPGFSLWQQISSDNGDETDFTTSRSTIGTFDFTEIAIDF